MGRKLTDLKVLIKGGGEQASGVAHRLFRSNFKICITEIPNPRAVRREVAFCEAVYEGENGVEGVVAKRVGSQEEIFEVWKENKIPLLVDPQATVRDYLKPDILIDGTMAKTNLGLTKIIDAPLVIALGPGFWAGRDAHLVIETNRGHNLGRVVTEGETEKFTGVPEVIGGFGIERVLRSPRAGRFISYKKIGDYVQEDEIVGEVDCLPVKARIKGILRGLIRNGLDVRERQKLGDVDPRGVKESCYTISDKARAIGGGVLEGILMRFNT
jgi:xanthine dehydrogenase accessory factor